jgi:tetratricopeptide (TPR) repeat protein
MSRRLIVVWLCLGALGAGSFWLAGAWWFQSSINAAAEDLAAGRAEKAAARLDRLAKLGPLVGAWSSGGRIEIDYWLGVCRETEGAVDDAIAIWRRIPLKSARGANAALRLARLAIDHGRFAAAEEVLERTDFPPGSPAFAMREIMLQQVYLFEGRDEAQRRRKQIELASSDDPADVLRRNWLIDESKSFPIDAMKTKLKQAGEAAPDDDRVWLGKANLALRMDQTDEADRWITRCLERRPDDPAVWLARLDWAIALDREPEALEAMHRIPADRLSASRLERLRIWLAARRGDEEAEQIAADRVFALEPGAPGIIDRLAELTARAGSTERTAELRRRKAAIDRAADLYRERLGVVTPKDRFAELAEAAETQGRWFEAKGWWTLAISESSDSLKARKAAVRAAANQAALVLKNVEGKTVADLVLDSNQALAKTSAEPDAARIIVPTFRDDAKAVGLDAVYDNDASTLCRLPETMGGGVALIDYDGDGWLDVYAVNGGPLPKDDRPVSSPQRDRLFRNKGDGTFEDATRKSGLAAFPGGYGHGVTVGDYDGDGRPDLFVTRWRSYALYRNRGDGTFEDATQQAGLDGDRDWPTSAAFADLDNDGDLDLYVCHYCDWDPVKSPPCPNAAKPGAYLYCGPRMFNARPDHLFRNDGGRFVDVSDRAGITSADTEGRGLGVVAADLDDDGKIDLFVANDMTANFLFHNEGDWTFREVGMESGVATNAGGGYLAGMGVACGDLNGDGLLDLAVTNFYGESTTFYQNLGAGQFVDRSAAVGLSAPTRYVLGFGLAFVDLNNDGLLDVAQADGHVSDLSPHVPFAMPAMLLLGEGGGRLRNVSTDAGAPWRVHRLGRGMAVGDLDNDGKTDLLMVSGGAPLAYFHNQGPAGSHLTLKLEGAGPGAGSNRDAVGATATVVVEGRRMIAPRLGGGSFLSASDDRLRFGLGAASRVESVEVRWPSGRVDRHHDLEADRAYHLREGASQAEPLPGWTRSKAAR